MEIPGQLSAEINRLVSSWWNSYTQATYQNAEANRIGWQAAGTAFNRYVGEPALRTAFNTTNGIDYKTNLALSGGLDAGSSMIAMADFDRRALQDPELGKWANTPRPVSNLELYGNIASLVPEFGMGAKVIVGGLRTERIAARVAVAAEEVVPEGIVYLRTDITGKVAPYGGQAMNDARYLARQAEHARDFPNAKFEFEIIDRANPGRALDIAEHNFIQEMTGGVAARRSSAVSNLRDPVGAARRPIFGLPEPR